MSRSTTSSDIIPVAAELYRMRFCKSDNGDRDGGEVSLWSCGECDLCGGPWEGGGEYGWWFSEGIENGVVTSIDIFGV